MITRILIIVVVLFGLVTTYSHLWLQHPGMDLCLHGPCAILTLRTVHKSSSYTPTM
ncbi:hypothetical protein BJX99DRAFT_234120 [Aspergillus californicus]